jgi:hypothetical protein
MDIIVGESPNVAQRAESPNDLEDADVAYKKLRNVCARSRATTFRTARGEHRGEPHSFTCRQGHRDRTLRPYKPVDTCLSHGPEKQLLAKLESSFGVE